MDSFLEPWFVRVTDLKQYEYCQRIVYYEYCLPGIRPLTYKMEAGIASQDRVEGLEERRSLRAYGLSEGKRHFNVTVRSTTLGYTGQIDMVIETAAADGRGRCLLPVDFKLSRREPGRHFKLQLAAYALLLEENWGASVEQGAIYLIPARRAELIPITTRLRNDARRHLEEIRQLVQAQRMPAPTPHRNRCVHCEFRRFCNDVL
jgi:CRISPR-associated exonuclease Cas4